MAQHRNPRSTSKRVAVNLKQENVRLQAQRTAFSSSGNDRATREAAALQDAFASGTKLFNTLAERRMAKAELAGTQAGIEGRDITDDEKRNDAFMLAHAAVGTHADMVMVTNNMAAEWAEMDTTDFTPQQTQEWASARLMQDFAGLDPESDMDASTMRIIQPWAEKLELEYLDRNLTEQREVLQSETDVNFEIMMRDALNPHEVDGKIEPPTYSLDALNAMMFPIYGSQNTNGEIFDLVAGLSIELGKPELLEELQQKLHWSGGATAPGGDKEFTSKIQSAIFTARSQEQYNENQADSDDADLEEAASDEVGQAAMAQSLSKKPGAAISTIATAVATGVMDPDAGRTWISWINAQAKSSINNVTTDSAVYRTLTIKIAEGNATAQDIIKVADSLSADDIATLTARNRSVQSSLRSDPIYSSSIALVKAKYNVSQEILNDVPSAGVEQADMLIKFIDQYLKSPDKSRKAATTIIEGLGDATDWAAAFGGPALNTKSAIRRWKSQIEGSGADELLSTLPTAGRAATIQDLWEAKTITDEMYDELKKELGL